MTTTRAEVTWIDGSVYTLAGTFLESGLTLTEASERYGIIRINPSGRY